MLNIWQYAILIVFYFICKLIYSYVNILIIGKGISVAITKIQNKIKEDIKNVKMSTLRNEQKRQGGDVQE